ncbi:hypothetical protein EKE94_16035 [Mesobaculum littorinae]|uniref:Uncharacterized protein n=1 Tax=Mesobaculum littorinae TaxID=2486419 RepID=A0A438ADV7_9RHOB|nr:hypothetical protein [Mesobaculum littorinae]RVV96855.1 hypothetical protein EKE94_16035 [Mesobaculum littorinae]
MQALVPAETLFLTATAGIGAPVVLSDEAELMPALSLGDVLAEEMDLDVSYGTLVVIEPAGIDPHARAGSRHLGRILAEILLCVMRRGVFPLERETDALYLMACGFGRLSDTPRLSALGVRPAEFHDGLARGLGRYWSGAEATGVCETGLFSGPEALTSPETRAFLRALDPGFSVSDLSRIEAAVTLADTSPRSSEEVFACLADGVGAKLGSQGAVSHKSGYRMS